MTRQVPPEQQDLLEWLLAIETALNKAADLLALAPGEEQARYRMRTAVSEALRHVERLRRPG